jgi:putative sigma-54 modulation protein
MRIQVKQHAFEVDEALREHGLRQATTALWRFAPSLHDVTVRFTDVNGPRGGADDKVCSLHLELNGRRVIHVEERAAEFAAALDLACERAARVVARELRLQRAQRHARLTLA